MKISIVRGAFLNPFELQNIYPLKNRHNITTYSSLKPINPNIDLPLVKLPSPTDIPLPFYKYPILNRIFSDAHYLLGLEKMITGSDIVHVAETYYHYTHQALVAKRKGLIKKVVSTVWETIPHNNEGLRGRRRFKKESYNQVDHFLAVTQKAQKALLIEGVKKDKITVVPLGVDLKHFSSSSKHKNKSTLNVLFVGRFVEEKGVGDLVEALLKLKEKKLPVKLTLVGEGPLEKNFVNIKGVTVTKSSYKNISRLYSQADIFCLPSQTTPSWQEQYGMVFIEAMASRLPIVTTRTGAINEVCGNVALYVPQKSSSSLAKILEKLVLDKKLRQSLSSQSLKRAKLYYDHRQVADRIESVYKNLIDVN